MSTTLSLALDDLLPLIADQERNHPEAYPEKSIRALFDAGIIAGPFAEDLGGQGMKLVEAVSVLETIASASPSVALIASMPLGLAGIYGLDNEIAPDAHRAAFAAQTARVAADYRAGRIYAACNSEKGAGGSLAATKTVAARQSDGVIRALGREDPGVRRAERGDLLFHREGERRRATRCRRCRVFPRRRRLRRRGDPERLGWLRDAADRESYGALQQGARKGDSRVSRLRESWSSHSSTSSASSLRSRSGVRRRFCAR